MSKIYCYSLDFQKKEHEFENLDSLLVKIVGSKEQATKALDNPELSYRGFRLISLSKMPEILSTVLTERSEKIKKDYVDSITDLEKKVQSLEKKERKIQFKMDAEKEDFEDEISKNTKKFTDEKNELVINHKKEIDNFQKEFNINIESINSKHKDDIMKLMANNHKNINYLVDMIEKHNIETKKLVSEYNQTVAKIKDSHNLDLQTIYKERNIVLENTIKNKEIMVDRVKNKLNKVTKTSNNLIKIINDMVSSENSVIGLNTPTLPLIKETPDKEYREYTKDNYKVLSKNIDKISIEPLVYYNVFNKEELLDSLLKENKSKTNSSENIDIKTKKEPIVKEIDKEKPKTVETSQKVEQKFIKIKGIDVLTEEFFLKQDVVLRAVYLYDLNGLGVTPSDLKEHYKTIDVVLENDYVISKILHRASEYSCKYVDISELVKEDVAREKMKVILPTRKDYNIFFNIEDLSKKEEVTEIIKQDTPNENKKGTTFDWENFKSKFVKTEYLTLMFSKDSISLKDASSTLNIPAPQLKNMVGVMKKLGYEKVYNNDALLTPDELLLIIVADGWLQNLSNMRRNNGESLQSLMESLYPSWKEYMDNKK